MDQIDMGFVEKCEGWKLDSRFFPNKIGGKPAWLDLKHIPLAKNLECKHCSNPCIFLCQIYAPYENNVNAFHRTIFIFICRNDACCMPNDNGNLIILRSQLPRENEFYPFDPPDEKPSWRPDITASNFVQLCKICSLLAPNKCGKCKLVNYCSREHQIFDWKNGHKEQCKNLNNTENHEAPKISITNSSPSILFPEFELIIENDVASSSEDETSDVEKEEKEIIKYKELLENGKAGILQSCEDVDNDLSKMAMHDEDEVFAEFQNTIQLYPAQVLRYNRGGSPLYISNENQAKEIPKCEKCHGERQFEFQIMPQLLSYLNLANEIKSLDWGILAIFTCKNSCDIKKGYYPEYIWKQDII